MNADLATCPWCGDSGVGGPTLAIPGAPKPSEVYVEAGGPTLAPSSPDTMPCPYCQEQIKPDATRCRWCGETLSQGTRPDLRPPAPTPTVPVAPTPQYVPPPYTRGPEAPPGTTPLVLGLVGLIGGLVTCGLLLMLCPFAWATGRSYEGRCRAMGVEPDGSGKAGKILGIVGTVLLILSCLGGVGFFMLAIVGMR
jgi:hypothetical protein